VRHEAVSVGGGEVEVAVVGGGASDDRR